MKMWKLHITSGKNSWKELCFFITEVKETVATGIFDNKDSVCLNQNYSMCLRVVFNNFAVKLTFFFSKCLFGFL